MPVSLNRGKALEALNITPMIDVVFLLLIFFLVTSQLSEEARVLDIPLPSAANAQPMTKEPAELVVNIDQQGSYYVNDQMILLPDLERLILRSTVDNPVGQSVIVRADRRVALQSAVTLMDICIKCGSGYSLSIAEEESP